MFYQILLALHIISIICWMAGLLYLFRLFVYHAAERESVVTARFRIMEERLYKIITLPAMLGSFAFGFAMAILNPALFSEGWFHAKLVLVLLLAAITGFAGKTRTRLASGTCTYSHQFFRILNEVPTLLMILIVFLVILRPF